MSETEDPTTSDPTPEDVEGYTDPPPTGGGTKGVMDEPATTDPPPTGGGMTDPPPTGGGST